MASKDAATAHNATLDRMGALAKWIAAKAEEMTQIDRRIERRIDHLQRSEDNLRAMFEAIREQVASAHTVSSELQNRTFTADQRHQQADAALSDALNKASELADMLDAKSRELEQTAQTISQDTSDRLAQLMEQAHQAAAAAAVQPPPEETEAVTIQYAFEQRSAAVVASIRRSAVEQIDRLATQAAVAVEPILSRIDVQRERVEAQLRAAVETAEDALRRRAEELCRTGDMVVDNLEQRLARRLENVQPQTTQTIEAAERAMNQRLIALLDGARLSISATEADLTDRVAQLRPRLSQALQTVQDDLVEQMARLEEHAFAMTGWLEKRMTERVDALIARARTALSQTPTNAVSPLSPEGASLVCYADEYPAPAPPASVDVQVFVDRRTERTSRSTTASIFQ